MQLTGKVAVVTGSGRGLGLAYAKALAQAGACVVVNDVDEATATEAVAEIEAGGGKAHAVAAAVGPGEAADRLVTEAVETFGRLDVLVTNAGILRDKVLWKMTDEDFDAVVDVHLKGTFTCVRAAVRHFKEAGHGGSIVAIGSPAGQRGNFGQTNYSGAKAGIVGMVRTWALECARAGVDVNAVIPVAATEMTKTIPAFAPHIAAWEQDGTPFPEQLRKGKGFGVPEDVCGLIVFLASDAARGITGQAIGIGGDKLSLWSHPIESKVAYTGAGWSADDIAGVWPAAFGTAAPSMGEDGKP